ncbi:MAG: peroxiredoxin-like family protein [Thermomicrobiales bacterium]
MVHTIQTAPDQLVDTGDLAPDASVQTLNGDPVDLSTLWKGTDRGLAIVFLRHYGCPFCKEHAREIDSRSSELRSAGVSIAFIGCGSSDEARAFRDELRLNNPVFNDPDRKAYEAYGIGVASAGAVLNPRVMAGGVRAAAKGFLPRRSSGNPLQLQGQFLVGRDGIIHSVSRPAVMSDIPPASDLLAQAMSLPWP